MLPFQTRLRTSTAGTKRRVSASHTQSSEGKPLTSEEQASEQRKEESHSFTKSCSLQSQPYFTPMQPQRRRQPGRTRGPQSRPPERKEVRKPR